jgi:hypothetical protein
MAFGGAVQWGAYVAVAIFGAFFLANLIIIGARLRGDQKTANFVATRLKPIADFFRIGDAPKKNANHSGA